MEKEEIKKKLKSKYWEMYELTRDKCHKECKIVTCCGEEHCDFTKQIAKEVWGVELEETQNEKLPFLGDNDRCVLEPHLRPICTVHICERIYMTDLDFYAKYFQLRDELSELESEIIPREKEIEKQN